MSRERGLHEFLHKPRVLCLCYPGRVGAGGRAVGLRFPRKEGKGPALKGCAKDICVKIKSPNG